jgi:hypothetical protein
MAQCCSTLLVCAECATALLHITYINTVWHSAALHYWHMLSVPQHCCMLLVYTQYGTVLLYIILTCRTWHSTDLHYLHIHNMTQYCFVLLVYTQYCSALHLHARHVTAPLSITCTCTSNALYNLHVSLTAKFRVVVKALHSSFQFSEVH